MNKENNASIEIPCITTKTIKVKIGAGPIIQSEVGARLVGGGVGVISGAYLINHLCLQISLCCDAWIQMAISNLVHSELRSVS